MGSNEEKMKLLEDFAVNQSNTLGEIGILALATEHEIDCKDNPTEADLKVKEFAGEIFKLAKLTGKPGDWYSKLEDEYGVAFKPIHQEEGYKRLALHEINELEEGQILLVKENRINWKGRCKVSVKPYESGRKITTLTPVENQMSKGHFYSFWEYEKSDRKWIEIYKEAN